MSKTKVLWVTNQVFPEFSEYLGFGKSHAGGWMYGLAHTLKNENSIDLHVATIYDVPNFVEQEIAGITYYVIPHNKSLIQYNKNLEGHWDILIKKLVPDIVHIHGTEYPHGLALVNQCPNLNYIVSIQGMVSVYEKFYYAGISKRTILGSVTLRDILRRDTIFDGRRKYRERGALEIEYIQKVKHVMGRTDWDYAHTKSINPNISYHFCNETLRDNFYTGQKWNIKNVKRHSIFLSQAEYPIKGLHKVLEALIIVKREIPDIQLVVAGSNIIKSDTLSQKLKRHGYGRIIDKIIKKYNLVDSISFTGILSKEEMESHYLKSHLFICPSSIENSPNSLGEAQILGVPSIASYVGGNHNMVNHGKDGLLYRFEETEVLASYILNLFKNDSLCEIFSKNSIETASLRHNQLTNKNQLLEIYSNIKA